MPDFKSLASQKLESSGLDQADAKQLRLQPVASAAQLDPSFKPFPAIKIPYFHPLTGKPLKALPAHPDFYRIRYLSIPTNPLGQPSAPKYTQPPKSGIAAYFPLTTDWVSVLSDTEVPIIITEGEFKSAKASKEGFAVIGLGGVWSFKATKLGIDFLPVLDEVNWVHRTVPIVFDSDFRTNQQVCKAINSLAEELSARGALPKIVALPDLLTDGKTGLDDFLLERTPDDLQALIEESAPLTLARGLFKLNDAVAYVKDPGLVVTLKDGQRLAPEAFKSHAFSNINYANYVISKDGVPQLQRSSAADAWLKWPLRHELNRLTYRPGHERLTDQREYNLWPGWGVEPKRGDVKPFLKLVDHLFAGTESQAKQWFLRWCAYPIRYPGTKLFSSVVMYGRVHGTGKSLVGYSLGRIYGKNFTEINQSNLHGAFNEWAENKQFVMGDDVTGSDRKADNDLLKKLITQSELRLNPKYIPSYVVPDCINYLFTTNQPDAFFLEDTDRRFFIHEVVSDPLPQDFYVDYMLWLDGGGAAALHQWLRSLDLDDFNPAGHAFHTRSKERMIEDTRSDLGSWVRRLVADPDKILRVGQVALTLDLFTNEDLLSLYDPANTTKVTANGLGRELRRAGVPMANGGEKLRLSKGADRYYILRNRSKWLKASVQEARDHLELVAPRSQGSKFRKAR